VRRSDIAETSTGYVLGTISSVAEKVTSTAVLFAEALSGENPTDIPDGAFKVEKIAVSEKDEEVS